jgi:hypothetical protein
MGEQDRISVRDAYRAMFCFLEAYFERTKADEITVLLGSLDLAEDGGPMDLAMWQDWLTAVQGAIPRDRGIGDEDQ